MEPIKCKTIRNSIWKQQQLRMHSTIKEARKANKQFCEKREAAEEVKGEEQMKKQPKEDRKRNVLTLLQFWFTFFCL